MYVQKDGREVKLVVNEKNGSACIFEGKQQIQLTSNEASQLLTQKLLDLKSRAIYDLTHKVTNNCALESILEEYRLRVADCNRLARKLQGTESESVLAQAIEQHSEVQITSPAEEKGELIIGKRKKVIRQGFVPVRASEYSMSA